MAMMSDEAMSGTMTMRMSLMNKVPSGSRTDALGPGHDADEDAGEKPDRDAVVDLQSGPELITITAVRPKPKNGRRDTEAQRGRAATKLEDGSAASGQRSAFSGQLRIRASG